MKRSVFIVVFFVFLFSVSQSALATETYFKCSRCGIVVTSDEKDRVVGNCLHLWTMVSSLEAQENLKAQKEAEERKKFNEAAGYAYGSLMGWW